MCLCEFFFFLKFLFNLLTVACSYQCRLPCNISGVTGVMIIIIPGLEMLLLLLLLLLVLWCVVY